MNSATGHLGFYWVQECCSSASGCLFLDSDQLLTLKTYSVYVLLFLGTEQIFESIFLSFVAPFFFLSLRNISINCHLDLVSAWELPLLKVCSKDYCVFISFRTESSRCLRVISRSVLPPFIILKLI